MSAESVFLHIWNMTLSVQTSPQRESGARKSGATVFVAVTFMKYYNRTEKSTEQQKQNRSSCISWLLISFLFLFFRWLPPSFCVSHQHDIILLLPNYLPLQLSHDYIMLVWHEFISEQLIFFFQGLFLLFYTKITVKGLIRHIFYWQKHWISSSFRDWLVT